MYHTGNVFSRTEKGCITQLETKDLEHIEKYQLYKIMVYKTEEEQYTTFCTPECAKYINQYLEWRERIGEKLQPTSPLFRIQFDPITQVNRPKSLSVFAIAKMVSKITVALPLSRIVESGIGGDLKWQQ